MFLSAIWTLVLTAPIYCRGSIIEQVLYCYTVFLQIILDEETNSSKLRFNKSSANIHFWVNNLFKVEHFLFVQTYFFTIMVIHYTFFHFSDKQLNLQIADLY